MARSGNVRLSTGEEHVLAKLTAFATYGGRYPIPTRWEHKRPRDLPDGSFGPLTGWISPTDDETVDRLIEVLKAQIEENEQRDRAER